MMRSREKRWGAQKTTMGKQDLLHPHAPPPSDAPSGSAAFRTSPQRPPPRNFPAQYLRGVGQWQCWRLHAGACCARRGRSGPISGVATRDCQCLLPSRKAVGLPQQFRERPFPAGTSPRKPIPGREPRAIAALPVPSSSTVRGRNPQLHPTKRGYPHSCPLHHREGRSCNPYLSIFLPSTGQLLPPIHSFI